MFGIRRLRRLCVALATGAILASSAEAQITTGTMTGTITDAQSAVLPGATVVVVSETQGTRTSAVVTNEQGVFVVPNLAADTYSVEVTLDGFKTLTRRGIEVSGGARVAVPNLTLDVGAVTESVQVTAEAPLIQAASGERSFTVSRDLVENLPITRGNFTTVTAFAPGVQVAPNAFGITLANRLGGGGATNIMIDGISTVDSGNNVQLLQLNVDAIAEVRVLTSTYQAEYGRTSGLQITAVTKSGTNQFHGSVYDASRRSDWNAIAWADRQNGNPKPLLKQDDFGYTVGGPVGKPGGRNNLFFFFGHEYRPRSAGGQTRQFRFPTELERNGDFSQTRDQNGNLYNLIRDASTGLPCTAADTRGCFQDGGVLGRIPQNRLYPLGLNILKMYPLPNLTPAQRPGVGYNYEFVAPVDDWLNHQPTIRLDYQPFSSLRGTFKYTGERQTKKIFTGSLPGFNDTMMHDPTVSTMSTTVNYTINPTTFLEGTYGYARNAVAGCGNIQSNCTTSIPMSQFANKRNVGLADLPFLFPEGLIEDPAYYQYGQLTKLGAPFFENGTIMLPPSFQWGARITTPPPNNNYPGFINFNRTQDVSVNLTKVYNNHTFKFGFYSNHSHKAENRAGGPGTLNFAENVNNPLDSSFGFANAAVGVFNSFTQLSRFLEGRFVYDNREFYVQDNWKVNKRLTLDYGMRFVHQTPTYDSLGKSVNFLPDRFDPSATPLLYLPACPNNVNPCAANARQAQHPITGALLGPNSFLAIGTVVPGTGNGTNGLFEAGNGIAETAHEWPALAMAPRFGLAYDVTGNQTVVLRGGLGLFFDRPSGATSYDLITNPPNTTNATVSFGQLQTLGQQGVRTVTPATVRGFQYEADLPSSLQWNGGVQFALAAATVVDVSYTGNYSYNLFNVVPLNGVDYGAAFLPENQDPTRAPTTVRGANALQTELMRSYKGYGDILMQFPRGWTRYHSLQTALSRRLRSGLAFSVNHTLGLSFQGNSPARLEHPAAGQWRYRDDQAAADDLLSDQNLLRHLIKANFIWSLPRLNTENSAVRRAVGAVVNEWQLAGVYTGTSGDRYSILYAYDTNGENVNITGSPSYGGRVVITGDPGSGCSDDLYRQFNTAAFSGPLPGSVGLESGQNYMGGCFQNFWDMSLSRNIRIGGSRQFQFRVDVYNLFNTVVYNARNTTVRLASPTDQRVTNAQFDASGNLVPSRLRPNNAGFGAATAAAPMRSVQLQLRFQF